MPRNVSCCLLVMVTLACWVSCREGPQGVAPVSVPTPQPLTARFVSFQTPDQVRQLLDANLLPWRVVESTESGPRSSRPPFRQLVVAVSGFEHSGHAGELQLHFFNDRLMEVRFFPPDIAEYSRALRDSGGPDLETAGGPLREPRVRVWTAKDFKGRPYVGWADTNLEREYDDWIRKNA